MRPLIVIWPWAAVFWIVYVWAFFPEWLIVRRARRSAAAQGPQDAGTLRLILVGQGITIGLAFLAAFVAPGLAIVAHRELAFWVGLGILIAGALLRRHCFRTLGSSFTGAVEVVPGQEVVERGAYRWVRHPSYTAAMLLFLGIGLALGNWLSVLLLAVVPPVIYGRRVAAEERALVGTLGASYERYMRRTKRYVPFVV